MSPPVLSNTDARGIATLTLNRPAKRNAFDAALIQALHQQVQQCEQNPAVRVVVLTGTGEVFCAGGDLAHMQHMGTASQADNITDALAVAQCLQQLNRCNKPVIARVNGNAFGGGVGLIACADIAIASHSAQFSLSEVRLGLAPAVISPFVIAAIGARQARRLFLTAEVFNAHDALQLGLLHHCVAAAELDHAVEQQIKLLLQGAPLAQSAAKQLLTLHAETTDAVTQAHCTAQLLAELRLGAEGQEGLRAFLEKRKPKWVQ